LENIERNRDEKKEGRNMKESKQNRWHNLLEIGD
jgi:hypothetical protein